ncbi:MAG: hypothetical protein KBH11_14450 [Bacteroidia bacterium]|nr:hypothetical protein [Bacteroidota bacterium]MBP9084278.1 hypothetical protein [Bacteroidia bacterium]
MNSEEKHTGYVLPLISVLFSLIFIAFLVFAVMMIKGQDFPTANLQFQGFLTGVGILTITTGVISGFLWWIVIQRKNLQPNE